MKTVSFSLAFLIAACCASAQSTGTASPSGATIVTISGNADNYLSIPYPQDSIATVRIAAVSESFLVLGGDISDIASLPFNEEGLYYAEITTGDLAGVRYDIVSLSNNSLFLDTGGDDLRNHPAGTIALDDQLRVIEHWTLGNIFGATDDDIILEPTQTILNLRDLVFLPDNISVGINKTPLPYYYLEGQGWRSLSNPVADQGNVKIMPGYGMIVRRRVAGDVELVSFGNNRFFPFSVYIQGGDGSSPNDLLISLQYPSPVTLDESGLAELQSDGEYVVVPSPSPLNIRDQVFLYAPGSNTPITLIYVANQGWFDGNGDPAGNLELEPGGAFYVRKSASSSSTDWFFSAD